MEIETVATPSNDMTPKRSGRKPGSPKVPGSGRIKGKPTRIPEDIRLVCREVLGLENLAIRKRLKRWLESGEGLGSTTFRHVLQMGYGQPKHAMISGDQQQNPLVFATQSGYAPFDPRHPAAAAIDARSKAMNEAKDQEILMLARDAEGEKAPVVIDTKATAAEDDAAAETLESVNPDDPSAFGGGGRGR